MKRVKSPLRGTGAGFFVGAYNQKSYKKARTSSQIHRVAKIRRTQILIAMNLIRAHDFCLVVSMTDFVTWPSDEGKELSENKELHSALNVLDIYIDLRTLHANYFERTPIGSGDVYVYHPNKDSTNIFAVDLYRGLTDQLDIVSFAVRCEERCLTVVRSKLRSFFDQASCQVHYEEASYSPRLRKMIDPKTYPVIIDESGYEQQMHDAHSTQQKQFQGLSEGE